MNTKIANRVVKGRLRCRSILTLLIKILKMYNLEVKEHTIINTWRKALIEAVLLKLMT